MRLIPTLIFSVRSGYFFILIVTALLAGLIAEAIRKSSSYDSSRGNLVSYAVFSLSMVGNLLPIWLFRDSFLANMVERGMPEDYETAMEAATPLWMLLLMIAVTFAAGFIGGWFGNTVVKKHLKKAGMVR